MFLFFYKQQQKPEHFVFTFYDSKVEWTDSGRDES